MSDFLILRFPHGSADNVEWIKVDASGAVLGEPDRGDAIMAAAAAADTRVIALVPGTSVLRTSVDLPVRGAGKMLQALPFAMEESLAADVDNLHFAAGKREPDGRLAVAAVERLEMEAWLELLAAAGVEPIGLYADSDAVSPVPNTVTLLVETDAVTLRDADGAIAVADPDGAQTMLDLWFRAREAREPDDAAISPLNLLVYVTEDARMVPAVQTLIANLRPRVASLDMRVLADGALPRLAAQIVTQPGINLLQGAYAPRSNWAVYWPAWRVAAALLLCLVVTLVGGEILEISSLRRQAASLDASIEQALRYTFPEVREVRDARALLQSKLRAMGRGPSLGGGSEFMDTLQAVATAISGANASAAKLETINYRSGVMELRVLAPNVEALDAIRKQITEAGALEAEIQSANPEGERVLGRIQITNPGV